MRRFPYHSSSRVTPQRGYKTSFSHSNYADCGTACCTFLDFVVFHTLDREMAIERTNRTKDRNNAITRVSTLHTAVKAAVQMDMRELVQNSPGVSDMVSEPIRDETCPMLLPVGYGLQDHWCCVVVWMRYTSGPGARNRAESPSDNRNYVVNT